MDIFQIGSWGSEITPENGSTFSKKKQLDVPPKKEGILKFSWLNIFWWYQISKVFIDLIDFVWNRIEEVFVWGHLDFFLNLRNFCSACSPLLYLSSGCLLGTELWSSESGTPTLSEKRHVTLCGAISTCCVSVRFVSRFGPFRIHFREGRPPHHHSKAWSLVAKKPTSKIVS